MERPTLCLCLKIIATVIVASLFLLAIPKFLNWLKNRCAFVPCKFPPFIQPSIPFTTEIIPCPTGDEIVMWHFPSAPASKRTILFFHGNGGNLGNCVDILEHVASYGFRVCAIDYRGYGASGDFDHSVSETSILQDAMTSLQYICRQHKIAIENIIVYGFSLGSQPALYLASQYSNLAAVVIHNGFQNIWKVGCDLVGITSLCSPLNFYCPTLFNAEKYVKSSLPAMLIVHSENDEVCSYQEAQNLFSKISNPNKLFITQPGTHIDFEYTSQFKETLTMLYEKDEVVFTRTVPS